MSQPILDITADRADKIYRVLASHADADPTLRKAFVHHMSVLGQVEWRIKAGWYGPTCFYVDNNEWFVTTTREDKTTATRDQIDNANLQLALLRDSELP